MNEQWAASNDVVLWAAEECERQRSGERSVFWMLSGWHYNVPVPEAIPVARSEVMAVAAELARWQGGEDATVHQATTIIEFVQRLKRAVDPLIVSVRVPGPALSEDTNREPGA